MGFDKPEAERAEDHAKHPAGEERRETGRLEALSDGVFAIAMTLLVLGIRIPGPGEVAQGDLFRAAFLAHHAWLSLVAYAVSFLAILAMWVNHHYMFQFVARVDRVFVILNGLLLMLVVFVNYPTALVANFIGSPGDGEFAAVAYNVTLIVVAILFNGMWFRIVGHKRLLVADADPAEVAGYTRQYRIGGPLYVVALALAFFNPIASVALDAALVIYWTFTGRMIREHRRPAPNPHP